MPSHLQALFPGQNWTAPKQPIPPYCGQRPKDLYTQQASTHLGHRPSCMKHEHSPQWKDMQSSPKPSPTSCRADDLWSHPTAMQI
jgi:hypothetical protein